MLAHLEKSDSVYVKFDARRDGVRLPPHLKRDAAVVLQYGRNMRIPIPDLDIGDLVYSENIGAYSHASSTYFNGFPPAKVVHINK